VVQLGEGGIALIMAEGVDVGMDIGVPMPSLVARLEGAQAGLPPYRP